MFAIADDDTPDVAVTKMQSNKQPGNGGKRQPSPGRQHHQRGRGTGSRNCPTGAEQRAADEVVTLWLGTRESDSAAEHRVRAALFEPPQQGQRRGDGRTHQPEDVEFVKAQHPVNGVELMKFCSTKSESEAGTEQGAEEIEAISQRSPPVARRKTYVTMIAVPIKVAVVTQLAGDRCAVPQMPWPEVQPPDMRAP